MLAAQEFGGVFLKTAPNRVSFSVNLHFDTALPELALFGINDRFTLVLRFSRQNRTIKKYFWFSTCESINMATQKGNGINAN